jgi:hypothetical protein
MKYPVALSLLAMLAAGGCSEPAVTGPMSHDVTSGINAALSSSARSGPLNIRKECSAYTGHAGEICTITSSNLKAIEVGSTIRYAKDAVAGFLDTDVILNPPGPGSNVAFGHCTLSLITGVGACSLSGGTGRFTWLQADVAVSPLGGPNFAWTGTYSYSR